MGIEYEKQLYHQMEHLRSDIEGLYKLLEEHREFLDEMSSALNQTPNRRYNSPKYKHTYELMAAYDKWRKS